MNGKQSPKGRAGPTGSKKRQALIKYRSGVRVIPGPPFDQVKHVKHRHSGGVFVSLGSHAAKVMPIVSATGD